MNLFKSKQEKEIERKIKARQGKKAVERHVSRQRVAVQLYWELAKRAYRLKDAKMFEQIAALLLMTQRDITQWERRLVHFDMVEAQRDQVLIAAEFAQAYQEMARSMLANTDRAGLAKIQKDIEIALTRADMMDDALEILMDMSEAMLEETRLDDHNDEIGQIMAALKIEANAETEAPDDAEIEAGLHAIEEQLKRNYAA